jgi:outer membrane protein insertion porin family
LIRHGGLWLLLFLGWLPAATAQPTVDKVYSIVVTNVGPKVASDELVRANIHVKPGDTYIRASVDKDVLNLYSTGFFSNIRVTDQHTDEGVVVTYILQGKFRLTGINFEGNTKFTAKKLEKKLSSKIGDPLDERKLFEDSQEIQKMYEKAGYQRSTVKYVLSNFDYESGRANVTFQITETPKIKIVEVDFTGAHDFTQKKLRHVIKTRSHWMFSWLTRSGIYKEDQFNDDKDTLTDFYRDAGYIDFEIKDIKITNPTPTTMKIEFVLFEGNLYKVGAVTFTGNKLFTTDEIVAELKHEHEVKRLKTKIGEHGLEADVGLTFKPKELEDDIKSIQDFYGSKGYINVREGQNLRVDRIPNTETGTMDLGYNIEEGDKVYIEKILIKGNVKTKDKVIRREMAVSPGDVFDAVRVELSKKRLEGLDYFAKVDTKPSITDVPNHDDLIVGVDEKSTGNFTFGAGFNTEESLFGYAEISQNNFDLFNPPYYTGGGEKFRLRVQLGTELQDYLLSFEEPWFLNRHLRLGVDLYRSVLNYISLDSLYNVTRTGAKVSLSKALGNENIIGGVSYTLEDVGIVNVNTNAPTIIQNTGSALYSRFGANITYDSRNSYELPNKGQQTGLSGLLTLGDRDYYRVELKSSWFFPGFALDHVLQISLKGGVTQSLDSGDVPFYDRFYLGGQDSLRGYDYNGVGPRAPTQDGTFYEPIGGDTYWFASAEYSVPIIDRLRFAVFYDVGNVASEAWSNNGLEVIGRAYTPHVGPGGTPVQQEPPFGSQFFGTFPAGNTGGYSDDFGFGIRLSIPSLGPLRLDYGIPLHRDPFNGPSGKFQFGAGFSRPL